MITCTITTATGLCGKPAVATFVGITTGEMYAECAEHCPPYALAPKAAAPKAAKPKYCKKAACVEAAMGYEFVAHLAGTCVTK
jgi:hypothetical protein